MFLRTVSSAANNKFELSEFPIAIAINSFSIVKEKREIEREEMDPVFGIKFSFEIRGTKVDFLHRAMFFL